MQHTVMIYLTSQECSVMRKNPHYFQINIAISLQDCNSASNEDLGFPSTFGAMHYPEGER